MEQYADISGDQYKNIWKTIGDPENTICGYAIAVGRLVDCRKMRPEDEERCFVRYRDSWMEERKSKKTGKIKIVKKELFCHIYEDVKAIEPIALKGAQGWRKLTSEFIDKIKYT